MKRSLQLLATDHMEELIKRLMPSCLPLKLQDLVVTAQEVTLMLVSGQSAVCCPLCAEPSTRVHSHYIRTLQDLPWGPLRVQLHLQAGHHAEPQDDIDMPRAVANRLLAQLRGDLGHESFRGKGCRLHRQRVTTCKNLPQRVCDGDC